MTRLDVLTGARLLVARYRGVFFMGLLLGPMSLALVFLGSSPAAGLSAEIGLPLYEDGRVETWVLLCLYAGVVAAPLLSWSHADFEVSASAFERRSCYVPQGMAHLIGLATLAAIASAPSAASATFWVSLSMTSATLWAIVLRQQAWVGTLASALFGLSLILEGRLVVWRTTGEASAAALVWCLVAVAAALRQRRLLVSGVS